ncbi:alpha/beta fold hydrolase [Streptomyces sp. NPDC048550]|uniref:alpha/beta fold hydrolase n=1 Tax=unclassified Streptomyces TaxID=2593676 RepID=UPI003417B9F0
MASRSPACVSAAAPIRLETSEVSIAAPKATDQAVTGAAETGAAERDCLDALAADAGGQPGPCVTGTAPSMPSRAPPRTLARVAEHLTLTVNGIRLAYQAAGAGGDDPPVVLLHALGERAEDWALVRDALARDRRVYALDLRGHGLSGRPARYSVELMRDDVLGFLDALGLDRIDLVGHSLGGVVAYLVAAEQPHRIGRLVLEDAPAPLPRASAAPVRPEGELDFDWAMVLAVRPELDRPDPAWLTALERITAPTLVVHGGPTSHLAAASFDEITARIPDARLITLPYGHLIHAAAPEEFTRTVTDFLAKDAAAEPGPL